MWWLSSKLLLLYTYYLSCFIINTYSQCQYVAYDLDLIPSNTTFASLFRTDTDDFGTEVLPPFPRLSLDPLNETFSKIPYPIDVCLENANEDSTYNSFKYICSDGNLGVQQYQTTDCSELAIPLTLTSTFISNYLEYDCTQGLLPCDYISVNESYYYTEDNIDDCSSQELVQNTSFKGIYAVDVCIEIENNRGSFKYLCDEREETYTFISYSDQKCTETELDETSSIVFNECVNDDEVAFDVSNETEIGSIFATFIECTSESEYEQTLEDYCVSSQIELINNDKASGSFDTTAMGQIGPFGMEPVTEKKLILFDNSACNICDISSCNDTEINKWDDRILVINAQDTVNLTDNCDGGASQFVMNLENENLNASIQAVIFVSNGNISMISDESQIPTRIVSIGYFNAVPPYNTLQSGDISIATFSLQCNDRQGYPAEICLYIDCAGSAANCTDIIFSGTYLIQVRFNNYNPSFDKPIYLNPIT